MDMDQIIEDVKKPEKGKRDVVKFFNEHVFQLNFYRSDASTRLTRITANIIQRSHVLFSRRDSDFVGHYVR